MGQKWIYVLMLVTSSNDINFQKFFSLSHSAVNFPLMTPPYTKHVIRIRCEILDFHWQQPMAVFITPCVNEWNEWSSHGVLMLSHCKCTVQINGKESAYKKVWLWDWQLSWSVFTLPSESTLSPPPPPCLSRDCSESRSWRLQWIIL